MRQDKLSADAQLWQVVSEWSGAHQEPFDCIETMLEMAAIIRLATEKSHDGQELPRDAFNLGRWEEARYELADALSLPPPTPLPNDSGHGRQRLLEYTWSRIRDIISEPHGVESLSRSLLSAAIHIASKSSRHREVTPQLVTELTLALANGDAPGEIYIPFESSGWMPAIFASAGWSVKTELRQDRLARMFKLFGYIGDWPIEVHLSDPLLNPSWLDGSKLARFPHSAAIATFGLRSPRPTEHDRFDRFPYKLLYGEAQQLAHLVAQTRGRIIIIVPESLLFRATGSERDYKENLIRRGWLKAVIRLPKSTFAPWASVQTSILLLDTEHQGEPEVLFLDASDDLDRKGKSADRPETGKAAIEQVVSIVTSRRETPISTLANYDNIAAQDFNISVDRYVRSEDEQQIERILEQSHTVELINIAELIRPQSVQAGDGDSCEPFAEVGLQDIQPDGSIAEPAKVIQVDDRSIAKVLRQKLEPGDILVSVRGRIGAVGIVPEEAAFPVYEGWIASQAFVVVRLRNTSPIDPVILYRYLASPLGQQVLQSLATGATVPMVSMGDMKRLRIIIPSEREQREIEEQYEKIQKLRDQIRQLQKLTDELNAASWPMTKVAVIQD